MIPDFIRVKSEFGKFLNFLLEDRKKFYSPIHKDIGRSFIHEGNLSQIKRKKDSPEEIKMHKVTTLLEIDVNIVKKGNIDALLHKINELAKKIVDEEHKVMVTGLAEISHKHNRTFETNDVSMYEFMINGLEKLDIEFDKNGDPIMPVIFCDPNLYKALQQEIENETEIPEELKKKHEDLIKLKKREFYERENSRKLVD